MDGPSDDANVYACTFNGTVIKTDAFGNNVWTTTVGGQLWDITVDTSGNTYVASFDGKFHKLNTSGTVIMTVNDPNSSNITGIDVDNVGYIFTSSADGWLRKWSAAGNMLWEKEVTINGGLTRVRSGTSGDVHVTTTTGEVHSYTKSTAVHIWSFTDYTSAINAFEIDRLDLYVTGYDNKITRMDIFGFEVWTYDLPSSGHSIGVDKNLDVYVGMDNGDVIKLDSSGALQWTLSLGTQVIPGVINKRIGALTAFPRAGAFEADWI